MGSHPAPRAPRISLRRLCRRLAREDGVTLVETVIAAAILVMIVGAVLATLDASSSATTTNRVRTVASALAEQDQENLRAMRTQDLANLVGSPRTAMTPDKRYTTVSTVEWVRDATSGEANAPATAGRPTICS
jgi:Tfp pilus assembly protein PilV